MAFTSYIHAVIKSSHIIFIVNGGAGLSKYSKK